MVRRLGRDLLFNIILWRSVVDRILITKKGFWGKTTCRGILNWVLSLNLQMTTRILMLCIANTRRIVLQSRSLVHNTASSGHFGCAIRRPFLEQNPTIFRCYKIAIFFQTRFKLWNSVFEMLKFQNTEKVISLHIHFKLSQVSRSASK